MCAGEHTQKEKKRKKKKGGGGGGGVRRNEKMRGLDTSKMGYCGVVTRERTGRMGTIPSKFASLPLTRHL